MPILADALFDPLVTVTSRGLLTPVASTSPKLIASGAALRDAVPNGVGVGVMVAVAVGVRVGVVVGFPVGVAVGVALMVRVGVGVIVGVRVAVEVALPVGVGVGVVVGFPLGVAVGVALTVGVGVGVGDGDSACGLVTNTSIASGLPSPELASKSSGSPSPFTSINFRYAEEGPRGRYPELVALKVPSPFPDSRKE